MVSVMTAPLKLHNVLHSPTSQACPGASGWHPFPLVWELHHMLRVVSKFAMGALNPTVPQIREAAYYL